MRKTGLFLMTALLAGLTMFTSCKKEESYIAPVIYNTSLTTPAYEDVSAKYVIQGNTGPYKSIELTASGNYVIVKRTSAPSYVKGFFGQMEEATRATTSGNIIYGKFTKKSDTEFELKDFGTIVVETEVGTGNTILNITPNGGTTMSLPAQRTEQMDSPANSFTSKLCRTWSVASFRYTILMGGQVFFDGEYTTMEAMAVALANKAKSLGYSDADVSDLTDGSIEMNPKQIIFSKSGTYLVVYKNSSLAVSTWTWKNESQGILHYSWDYDNMYSTGISGDVQLFWRNNQLAIKENMNDVDSDFPISITLITYLNEAK